MEVLSFVLLLIAALAAIVASYVRMLAFPVLYKAQRIGWDEPFRWPDYAEYTRQSLGREGPHRPVYLLAVWVCAASIVIAAGLALCSGHLP